MSQDLDFFIAIAQDKLRPESEREEAIRSMVSLGDKTAIPILQAIYDEPGTANFKLIVMQAIGHLQWKLSFRSTNSDDEPSPPSDTNAT